MPKQECVLLLMFLEVQRLDSNALSVIFYLAPGFSNFYYRDVPVECNRPSLRRQANLVETLLFDLEPAKFPDPKTEEVPWHNGAAEGVGILAFGLRKTLNSDCPFSSSTRWSRPSRTSLRR